MSYIGQTGAAVYYTCGTRNDASGQLVKFADIANIEVVQKGRAKSRRSWQKRVVDQNGNRLMTLNGGHNIFAGKIIPSSTFIIASAIQVAWKRRLSESL